MLLTLKASGKRKEIADLLEEVVDILRHSFEDNMYIPLEDSDAYCDWDLEKE